MRTLRFTLTQEHWNKGTADDVHHCAVALAVREATGEADVRVTETDIDFGPEPNKFKVTPEIQGCIRFFDADAGLSCPVSLPAHFTLKETE